MKHGIALRRRAAGHVERALPTFHHFARAWHRLQKASRRSLEVGMLGMLLFYDLRLLNARGILPEPPVLRETPVAHRLAQSADDFFRDLWPSSLWWVVLLALAVLLGAAGLFQTYAALRGAAHALAGEGEDAEGFAETVDPAWLRVDVGLRRFAMLTGIGFFGTAFWQLCIHAGIFHSVTTGGIMSLCMWVDNRLFQTWRRLRAPKTTRPVATAAVIAEISKGA